MLPPPRSAANLNWVIMEHEDNLICDWCGDDVDEGHLAALVCGHPVCGRRTYHQACVEQWLRKSKLPPDRLSGFACPRGNGKKTTAPEPCKGRIDSSHRRIVPRANKKPKKPPAPVQVPLARPPPTSKPKPQHQGSTDHSGSMTPAFGSHTAQLSDAQMKALAATIRKELQSRTVCIPVAESTTRALKPPKPSAPKIVVQPGQGAAARLGTGKPEQPSYIPGMEPADTRPTQSRRKPRAAAAAPTPAAAIAPPAPEMEVQRGKPTVNALNGANGFVTDLDRYNALLRAMGNDAYDEDEFGNSTAVSPASQSAHAFVAEPQTDRASGGEAVAADGTHVAGIDGLYLTDQQIIMGYLYGAEAAGLPADLAPLVQQLYNEVGFAQGTGGTALEPHTPDQVAEVGRAAYLDAERVVAEAEAQQDAQQDVWQQQQQAAAWTNPVEPVAPPLMPLGGDAPVVASLPWAQPMPVAAARVAAGAAAYEPAPGLPMLKGVQPAVGTVPEVQAPADDEGDVDEELFDDLLSLCLAPAVK